MTELTGVGSRVGSRKRVYVVVVTEREGNNRTIVDLLQGFTDKAAAYQYAKDQRDFAKRIHRDGYAFHVEYVPMAPEKK